MATDRIPGDEGLFFANLTFAVNYALSLASRRLERRFSFIRE